MRTLRFPADVDEKLRLTAAAQHTTGQAIILTAVKRHLAAMAAEDSWLDAIQRSVERR